MFKFKGNIIKTLVKLVDKPDPLAIKFDYIDTETVNTVLLKTLGTERIETVGAGLLDFNKYLNILIKNHRTKQRSQRIDIHTVAIRKFFEEGDFMDVSGLMLLTFKRLSLLYINEVYCEGDDTSLYYYQLIESVVDRIIELGELN